jgi:hypothetical protein
MRITKCGDRKLRTLLVQCAHYILGRRGPDTDLQRCGARLAARGGKAAKKRAVVAMARKLAVLLFALLLRTGEVYEPLRNSAKSSASRAAAPRESAPFRRQTSERRASRNVRPGSATPTSKLAGTARTGRTSAQRPRTNLGETRLENVKQRLVLGAPTLRTPKCSQRFCGSRYANARWSGPIVEASTARNRLVLAEPR